MEIQKGDKSILLFLPLKLLPKAREHMWENMSRVTEEFGLIWVPAETERLVLTSRELMILLQWRAPTAAHPGYQWAFCLLGMSSQRAT